ncbi:MFS transporter [Kitasatospora viridis]|uniref:EmrB/QacA subfamily drug resistance transporter n=1 Tax=Kitasatospora viridis TaxID=281105 RepID=A0A561UL83_9ACTN|nr:MFS transporter [Kitasatospora viridis]TWG00114.1 EmrB/QacA subfamily drug resistance transporter [Kitasatospora viridis]
MATITVADAPAALSSRSKLILFVLCAAQFAVALDFSILNVALPALGADLGIRQADLQWGVTAFTLPSGGFLLLSGRLADVFGRRRLFLLGLALLTTASVLATVAWDPASFLVGRVLQGLGAAMIVPAGMALLTTTFREGPERDRALGVSGLLLSLGFTVGMLIGGVLTQALGWRSTMALNVLMGAAVLAVAPKLLTESRLPERPEVDVPGAVTITGGLLSLIYALSTAAQTGFGRPEVVLALAAGVLLLAAFAVIEARAAQPLVSLRVLRRRTVAFGNLGGLVTFAMMSAVIFLSTLYLQQVLGLGPGACGLVFGVMGLAAALGGVVAPKVAGRIGAPRTLLAGLLVQAGFTAAMVAIGPRGGTWLVAAAGSIACFGHLWAIVAYSITATSGLADEEQGLATGLVTSTQQVGLTVGIPLLSALASARVDTLGAAGHSFAAATLGGVRLGLGVDAAVVVAAALLTGLGLRAWRRAG